ncbi:hypothetical protein CRE_02988 [Caenorhabditis remanei]|uniref:Uncharacterized protein n=1 Tax=Caenorhabditis remanei TaxID=31234 RepID=E3LX25_CAERE|nr:hypothetical protein CRE_02988 [Caenorhabditis remanei]
MIFSMILAVPFGVINMVFQADLSHPYMGKDYPATPEIQWPLEMLPFGYVLHTAIFPTMHPIYGRIMSSFFFCYGFQRIFNFETLLIPKFPIRIPWKSIILIALFFSITGYFMFPYSVSYVMCCHVYVCLLSIETSIWYHTKEFRLICRWPREYCIDYHKAYYTTVHTNARNEMSSDVPRPG